MPSVVEDIAMPELPSRADYIDYLEAESAGAEPTEPRPRKNLVKSYVIETVRPGPQPLNAAEVFAKSTGLRLRELDSGSLFALSRSDGVVALVEAAESRFPVIHSTRKAATIDKVVNDAVSTSPWLDHAWLPGHFFDALWSWTRQTADANRLAKLKFSYRARYERPDLPSDEASEDADSLDSDDLPGDDEDGSIYEERHSQFVVADRVGVLAQRLEEMRSLYDPLKSTILIRIPSSVRGGHEVYHFGKITNRSVSFSEQQKIVRYVIDLYRRVTEGAEERLWYSTHEDQHDGGGAVLTGLPVFLAFQERLELSTLHRWARRTFGNRRNVFRLGGQPMWSGNSRLHVYGIDRHLWQPISVEVTPDHLLAVLPAGTCGNTINRLITNVQRYLSPSVRAWIGQTPYDELLAPESAA